MTKEKQSALRKSVMPYAKSQTKTSVIQLLNTILLLNQIIRCQREK